MKRVVSIERNITIKEAAKIMSKMNIGSLVLVKKDKAIGILTERDIIKNISSLKKKIFSIISKKLIDIELNQNIEDAAELMLDHPHLIRLESRPSNIEGAGEITIRQLVRNALRMRPDRIIVGECRGPEALDMLQAMNTGHPGSLTTLHANSPVDGLRRLETMVLMAEVGLPLRAIREQISSAIDVIVHLARDGKQRVLHSIVEVCHLEGEIIATRSIYKRGEDNVTNS